MLPILVLALAVLAETAGVAQMQVLLVNAAREGARAAAVAPDVGAAVAAVEGALPPAVAARVAVSVERTRGVGAPVRVAVRLPHRLFRALGGVPIDLGWTATMRSER